MRLTRRELAATLLGAAAASAQAPDENALVRAAADDLQKELAAINQVSFDYAVEPAFSFRAQ